VQQPHPPIVIGAAPTPVHLRHIIEFGDVWMPIAARWSVLEGWTALQQAAAEAGRDPATLGLGVLQPKPDAAYLAELRDGGCNYAALALPALDRDAALATMDAYRPLVEEFNT
jgi:alkanesulfonate monooxygenase SsuD/methylene tetrahydromethanopterin reductase-like flavin-dependent oxidoreductase (luciferase family)